MESKTAEHRSFVLDDVTHQSATLLAYSYRADSLTRRQFLRAIIESDSRA